MKRILKYLIAAFLTMITAGTIYGATPEVPRSKTGNNSVQSLEAETILARVNEIKAMDKSTMSVIEKKQLRKELRTAKKQLKAISGGVYISAGTLLLIAIILILLL